MKGHQRSLVALVFLAVLGQGMLFLHDLGHAAPGESTDCLVCLKLDKQELVIPAQSLPLQADSGKGWPVARNLPSPLPERTGPYRSRAPPSIS